MTNNKDHRVIACNIAEPTSPAAKGALAYVINPNIGWGSERIFLLIRSRGGRWIEKWEDTNRLGNFRSKTIPVEHPLYNHDLYPADGRDGQVLAGLQARRTKVTVS